MRTIERDGITVEFPRGSEAVADKLLQRAGLTRETFAPLFPTVPNLQLHLQWFPRSVWKERGHGPWGMPTAIGTDGVLLPATDLEMPDACVVIIDPLTDLRALSAAEVREMLALAPPRPKTRVALRHYLKSRAFYHDLMTDFVLPHEIFHVYCNNVGIRRQPVWPYESLAQWSSEWFLHRQGEPDLARFYHLCYRMYYLAGMGRDGNEGLTRFTNYAWFHGADTVMMGELGKRYGEDFIPRVVRMAQERVAELAKASDAEWVRLFSETAGEDLAPWFAIRFGGAPRPEETR